MTIRARAAEGRVLLWDLDGVLVRTEDLYFRATREVLIELDLELGRRDYHRLFLQESRDPLRLAVAERGWGQTEFAALHRRRLRRYCGLLGTEEIRVEGAAETIELLAERHVMGVVTGSKREHVEVLASRTDFFHLFDFVVTLDDVDFPKPHPEPYLQAVRRSGARPGACLAIEDSERGLRSAKAAGIECWVIPNDLTREADFSAADRRIGSIGELAALLTGIDP
jgi:HAD superfamily hydrolase (TIGR01509 family)